MKHLDLFSGIGGFAHAVDQVWEAEHIFCEIDPFCQKVLKKHWPNSKIYGDIRTITADSEYSRKPGAEETRENCRPQSEGTPRKKLPESKSKGIGELWTQEIGWDSVDLLTGGFPCQPFSQAGKRRGTADDRYLWPEMLRVIRLTKPTWIIGENVGGFVTWNEGMVLEQVCLDLENEGYEVQPFIIPAVSVNAPHRRDRVWIVANRPNRRLKQCLPIGETKINAGYKSQRNEWNKNWLEVATRLCRMDDGVSDRVHRLKALGNAIVPKVALQIIKQLI
jgi:DNA (cytosine-5)-methyltransferase 1